MQWRLCAFSEASTSFQHVFEGRSRRAPRSPWLPCSWRDGHRGRASPRRRDVDEVEVVALDRGSRSGGRRCGTRSGASGRPLDHRSGAGCLRRNHIADRFDFHAGDGEELAAHARSASADANDAESNFLMPLERHADHRLAGRSRSGCFPAPVRVQFSRRNEARKPSRRAGHPGGFREVPRRVIIESSTDTPDVYAIPDSDADLFFWNGWWWRLWEGRWYRSHYYDRAWGYYNNVPSFYFDVDPGWRGYYRDHNWYGHRWDYERIPNQQLRQNWKSWQNDRHWEKQGTWGIQGYQPRPQQQRQELRQQRQQQYQLRPEVKQLRQQPQEKAQRQQQQEQKPQVKQLRQQPQEKAQRQQQQEQKPQVKQLRQQPQEKAQRQQQQEQKPQVKQLRQQPQEKAQRQQQQEQKPQVKQLRQQPQEKAQKPEHSQPQGKPERGEEDKKDRK